MNNQSNGKKTKKKADEPGGLAGSVYIIYHDLVYILGAVIVLFVLCVRLVGVSGSSMYPTLVGDEEFAATKGDYLALQSNVLCAGYRAGDIVVACVPEFEEGKPIVKRVVAVGGQTVELKADADGATLRLWIDGQPMDEPYIREPMRANAITYSGFKLEIPMGCYFLMGDNRNNSTDSRDPRIGAVQDRYIVGRALMVLLPGQDWDNFGQRSWSRFGAIKSNG